MSGQQCGNSPAIAGFTCQAASVDDSPKRCWSTLRRSSTDLPRTKITTITTAVKQTAAKTAPLTIKATDVVFQKPACDPSEVDTFAAATELVADAFELPVSYKYSFVVRITTAASEYIAHIPDLTWMTPVAWVKKSE